MDKEGSLEKLDRALPHPALRPLLEHPYDSEAPGEFGELPTCTCPTLILKP